MHEASFLAEKPVSSVPVAPILPQLSFFFGLYNQAQRVMATINHWTFPLGRMNTAPQGADSKWDIEGHLAKSPSSLQGSVTGPVRLSGSEGAHTSPFFLIFHYFLEHREEIPGMYQKVSLSINLILSPSSPIILSSPSLQGSLRCAGENSAVKSKN